MKRDVHICPEHFQAAPASWGQKRRARLHLSADQAQVFLSRSSCCLFSLIRDVYRHSACLRDAHGATGRLRECSACMLECYV